MDSFFDVTLATSTVGVGDAVPGVLVLEPELVPQEAQKLSVVLRITINGIRACVMPLLRALGLNSSRRHSQGHQDQAMAT